MCHSRFRRVVGTLLLGMEDSRTGDGGEEYDGAASLLGDHVASASLGDEEGTCEVDVYKIAEHGVVVVFGFDVRAEYPG